MANNVTQTRTRKRGQRGVRRNMGPSVTISKKQELLTRGDVKQIIKKQMVKEAETKTHLLDSNGGVSSTMSIIDISAIPEEQVSKQGLEIW